MRCGKSEGRVVKVKYLIFGTTEHNSNSSAMDKELDRVLIHYL